MSRSPLKRFLVNTWEVLEVVLIAFVTVFVIRTFIAQPFLVSGASMEPTFENGNYLLIDETTYYFREPERGEVIVFRYPGDEKSFFIKRIIALPRETVTLSDEGVFIEDENNEIMFSLDENYILDPNRPLRSRKLTLADEEYFVLGDNRGNSFDSRSWGPLNEDHIVGLVRLRMFPFNSVQTFQTPIYNN